VISAHTKETNWVRAPVHRLDATHYVMFFTSRGKCYLAEVHELRARTGPSRANTIISCIRPLKPDERLASLVPVRTTDRPLGGTVSPVRPGKQGVVKKTPTVDFGNPRLGGQFAANQHREGAG